VVADPDNVMVVHGTSQGVDLVLRVLAASGARRIAVEDPSLPSQGQRITAHGMDAQPVPVDSAGVTTDGLDAAAVLVTPAHQFPTGVVLSGQRRRALLEWACRTGGLVLEDDYDAEFRYDRQPVRALQGLDPSHVVYLGTTSKTLAPALRLGWVVLPAALVPEARRIRNLVDVCPTGVDQRALAALIERGDYDRHVRRTRKTYQRRRALLTAALADVLPGLPVEGIAAGMHLVLRLPHGTDDREVAARARRAGIHVEPMSGFSLTGAVSGALVLGYGRIPERNIDAAAAALAQILLPAVSQADRRRRPVRSAGSSGVVAE
jgi:GntR family transcriptional regulator/MocR family aminotransferase